jgi:hypothetical protein
LFPTVADDGVIQATREKMIMGGPAGDGQQRGVFTVDTDRALEAFRVTWGNAYAVCFDDAIEMDGARWQAWRLGGHSIRLAGTTPDELNTAIRADWAGGGRA